MAACSTALLAGSLGVIPAHAAITHPDGPLITTRFDAAYEDQGGDFGSKGVGGDTAYFIGTGQTGYNILLDYQAVDGSLYWVHPNGEDSLCYTASTTQEGVIKVEGCVSPLVTQQLWSNPNNGTYYKLDNSYWALLLTDPVNGGGVYAAGLGSNATYGVNGSTMYQAP